LSFLLRLYPLPPELDRELCLSQPPQGIPKMKAA
jgi:hypothetical protein